VLTLTHPLVFLDYMQLDALLIAKSALPRTTVSLVVIGL
jgi:hypothetical protein